MDIYVHFSVWAWGWGIHGQLGLGTCDDTLTPTHVNEMDQLKVSVISAGFNHSAVISHLVCNYYIIHVLFIYYRDNYIHLEMECMVN